MKPGVQKRIESEMIDVCLLDGMRLAPPGLRWWSPPVIRLSGSIRQLLIAAHDQDVGPHIDPHHLPHPTS
jgi:hypothetical protein